MVAAMVTLDRKKRSKSKKGLNHRKPRSKGIISLSTYYRLHKFLDENFLTRGGYRKVRTRLSELSVYTSQEIQIYSVRFYGIATLVSAGLVVFGAIIFKDLFSTLLVLMYAIIMRNVLVDKQIDGIHFKLLKQLSQALSSVRQNYLRLGTIPDAIAEAESGSEIHRAFEDIYLILTAVDGEKRLEEFYASTPFKLLQTFAGVCYILNNAGDTKLRDGSSNFIQSMGMMAGEINLEIRRISLQKARFGMLEYLPVVPLAAIGVIENFFANIIPGTTVIYNGWIGYISRTVIILASIVGYTVIVKINSAVSVKQDDRNTLVMLLLRKKWYARLVKDMMPKKQRKKMQKQRMIKGALSMTDLTHLYGSKILFAVVAFAIALFTLFFAVHLGKEFVYTNVKEVSLIGGEKLTSEDIDKRHEMDVYFLSLTELPKEREVQEFVKQKLPKLPPFDQDAQVKRLIEKYKSYHNAYFKWWMIIIALVCGMGIWNVPELLLRGRAWLLKTESEEDVLQLQTIIAILMNTSTDTLETLYWLERQSRVHKNAILDAYHEYPSNPELALNRMKAKAVLPDFRRLVDKLILTIHQITLAEAFSDLVTERDHVMRIREISQNTTLNRKRSMVSPLAMAPLVLTAILYILIPLGILGFKEFVSALGNVKH
jgi:ribosomal protein L30/L7E